MLHCNLENLEYIGVTGALWKPYNVNFRDVLTITQKLGISEIVARVLSTRKVNIEEINDFLYPTLRSSLPDPFHLLDMDKAIQRICHAIYNKERIVIFGDYDVDGATSSALIKQYLTQIGVPTTIYIPDRICEGYGPNTQALLKLQEIGHSLCITVDCGTIAHEPISVAKSVNLDVIVIDHHMGLNTLPDAIAVINPNRLDENSPYTYLAGVGVSFLMLVALNKTLKEKGFFTNNNEPNLINYLDLVALGTVCDVMPIIGLNRAFVKQGLKIMATRQNIGLKVLSDVIGLEDKPNTYQLGFNIGPHINAGGRVGNASLGARLLSSNSEEEALEISEKLQNFNLERKELEHRSFNEAVEQAEALISTNTNLIIVAGNWHPGIIGIVAGRLKDKFFLPSIVISLDKGIGKASARSIPDVDLGAAILSAKLEGIITEGGGHAMAAGFSIQEDKIKTLHEFLSQRFHNINKQKVFKVDGIITAAAVNLTLWKELQFLEPFGIGNPEPRFILTNIKIKNPEIIGDSHIRCLIHDNKTFIKGICFRCTDTELGLALLERTAIMLLGKISVNYWKGNENIQFIIEDAITKSHNDHKL
ncbi:single-stranded-DNA-specific exonuclease RecJ [Ehrlichia chaffeensis str. Heartland]|uniref:single-stranded-DNA-specific exonuclease RecJ n=1 Tax=Ehrlichia chaffeensis TaxID=945 RepID=UPI000444AF3D|nr:single-stranded-DNA-specific exonuclease RecJ [Ehrlichia chaffeensis]AHX03245.1 single-stranded-DNA-specific exonuclease RecJ [Ehrlichia chaffeensis str. Heartland]AHX07457.1 single-stranded-DNA-specific exonuclease RecJ [Ehrlichia chaffeensis str. Osceola]AHX08830.1 single-stranded-DNA-specific exonuclease RecJ [Ehrlichia chaffeensis str. Saint Vincent]AHX10202.1 single-stranded-DNA-specific exonuclease RecJ [Ehrlichia chaffeensis str. West Paces]